MSFRKFLNELEEADELERVKEEVSPKYEIASKLDKSEKALLFQKVSGSEMKVVGNIFGSRERISRGLGIEKSQLISRMRNSLESKKNPELVSDAPAQEIIEEEVDLDKIPILKHFEKDGGPYVTSSIIVAKDSEGKRNLSFHRLLLLDKKRFTIRLVPRDLHNMFKEAKDGGNPLEVAAFLGVHPGVALAAATSPPYEIDEYKIAKYLSKELKLTSCKKVGLEVPAHSEIVLEGKLMAGDRAPEGPFADITGTYDAVREQPVFKVDLITRREDTIYPALLPGSTEHQLLMGMPREPLIFEEVSKVAKTTDVALTPGGCGWLHAVVSIDKKNPEDGKKAIESSFRAHSSLKNVVIVDDDIDIYSPQEIEWAIATRARADRDVVIKSEVRGSSLDPTADPETRLGSKMGIDATKDLNEPEKFERAHIPE